MSWERAQMLRSLSLLYRGGVPLLKSLEILSSQARLQPQRECLTQAARKLSQGHSLSHSLGQGDKLFRPYQLAILSMGEQTGTLDQSLEILASQAEQSQRLEREIRSQLVYPLFVLSGMLLLFLIILPQLGSQLTGRPVWQEFPWGQLVVFSWVLWLGRHALIGQIRRSRPYQNLQRALATCQFLEAWAALLEVGTPVEKSLRLAARSTPGEDCRLAVERILLELQQGKELPSAFAQSDYFGKELPACLTVGLESGSLVPLLKSLQSLQEMRLSAALSTCVALITPGVLVLLSGLLLFFLLRLVGPTLTLVGQL